MDAEFFELARRALVALEAANSTSWVEIAQLGVSGGGLIAILVGLKRMGEAGARRDEEINVLGKALERQGEMMTEALQGLRQQGEVLAELLRRGQ